MGMKRRRFTAGQPPVTRFSFAPCSHAFTCLRFTVYNVTTDTRISVKAKFLSLVRPNLFPSPKNRIQRLKLPNSARAEKDKDEAAVKVVQKQVENQSTDD